MHRQAPTWRSISKPLPLTILSRLKLPRSACTSDQLVVLFLVLSVVALGFVFIGQFSGPNARWGAILLGAIAVADLGRADLPWIVYWNYPYRSAANPIIDLLQAEALRVPRDGGPAARGAIRPSPRFEGVYGIEWTQQIFLCTQYSMPGPVIMEPRETVDNSAFRRVISALNPATLARHWQLTNTRYIFAPGNGAVDVLNQYLDPVQRRFRVAQRFDIVPKKDIPGGQPRSAMDFTAQLNPAGQVAMIEFTGALPRAKLYSNWQVNTNRDSTLATLADPAFDPVQTVVVGDPIPAPDAANTNQPAGAAEINPNYEPKRVEEFAAGRQGPVCAAAQRQVQLELARNGGRQARSTPALQLGHARCFAATGEA